LVDMVCQHYFGKKRYTVKITETNVFFGKTSKTKATREVKPSNNAISEPQVGENKPIHQQEKNIIQ
jgi:hypothetical protein